MKAGIFYHEKKVPGEVIAQLVAAFAARGIDVVLFSSEEEIGGVDRLLVLGGDGAMLRAARKSAEAGIPLVGVNYGHLGFLTAFERGEEARAVRLLADEHAECLSRAMLEAEFRGERVHCLNELAFMRRIAPDSKDGVVHLRVTIDGSPAGEFLSDGLIVSTPTGSTAYSLSAGGCILTPDCEAFLLTPVNAFSLRSRPIACSDRSVLSFTFPEGTIVLHGDGKFLGEAGKEDVVTVKKSTRKAIFLAEQKSDFFRRLTEKIN